MRRLRMLSVCLIAAFFVGAVASATASAEAPEFGRCVKKAKAEGTGFEDSGCVTEASGSGAKFEWVPGPGAKNKFTSVARVIFTSTYKRCVTAREDERVAEEKEKLANELEAKGASPEEVKKLREEAEKLRKEAAESREKAGQTKEGCEKVIAEEESKEPVVLQETSGPRIECGELSASGEYSTTNFKRVANVKVTFKECELNGTEIHCTSPGKEVGEIVTQTLDGELGYDKKELNPTKSKVGIDLFPAEGTLVSEFECVFGKTQVTGSVIHDVKINKMLLEENEKFSQKNGLQKPEKFEGMPADVLFAGSTQSGMGLLSRLINEEKIEVSTVN